MAEKTTGELLHILNNTHTTKELNNYLNNHTKHDSQFSFHEIFASIINHHDITKSEIIRRSTLDRTYAYQILNGSKKPSRDKILALCIAAECSLNETRQLLEQAKEGILYSRSRRDSIIMYGIEHHWNVMQVNEFLSEFGEKSLE